MVTARIVVGADGRSSFVATNVGAAEQIREPATRAMYYRYFLGFTNPAGAEPDGAEFSLVEDELVYAFPSDAGTTCVALSVNLEDFAVDAPGRGARLPRTDRRPSWPRPAALPMHPRWPAPWVRAEGPPGARPLPARAGRSSATHRLHQDPWTGNGMDNAGVHATFLAEAIDDWLAGRAPSWRPSPGITPVATSTRSPTSGRPLSLGRDLRQLATA